MAFSRQALTGRVPGEAIRVLPAPRFGPRRANPSAGCVGLVIPSGSTLDPAISWALVEWLALGEPAQERFERGQGLPAARPAQLSHPSQGVQPWQQQLATLVQKEAAETQAFVLQTSPYVSSDTLESAWSRQEERYLAGEVSLDEMLAAVESLAQAGNSAS